jgi:hypothetical protein
MTHLALNALKPVQRVPLPQHARRRRAGDE